MKILRSKKGLIYHGHLSSHNNASVKIVFNNNDNFFSTVSFMFMSFSSTSFNLTGVLFNLYSFSPFLYTVRSNTSSSKETVEKKLSLLLKTIFTLALL